MSAGQWCGNCRFFKVGTSQAFPDMDGMCRRNAPTGPAMGNGRWQVFPPMQAYYWCGDHERVRVGAWGKRFDDLSALEKARTSAAQDVAA